MLQLAIHSHQRQIGLSKEQFYTLLRYIFHEGLGRHSHEDNLG
jgi:hypothetical protein